MSEEARKRVELQSLHETIESMHEHVELLEKQKEQLEYVDHSLAQLRGVDDGAQILVQLASGIFVPAQIDVKSGLRVNVGADVVVMKDIDQTQAIVREQVEQVSDVHRRLSIQLRSVLEQFNQLHGEIDVQVSKE